MTVTESRAVTEGVVVEVRAQWSREHSDPRKPVWFFLYTITISNEGTETVKLLNRYWIITDGTGNVEHVRGPGVVGEQPVLRPGARFEYTSGCPLPTTFGFMEGSYEMVRLESGVRFEVKVAGFPLRMVDGPTN